MRKMSCHRLHLAATNGQINTLIRLEGQKLLWARNKKKSQINHSEVWGDFLAVQSARVQQ